MLKYNKLIKRNVAPLHSKVIGVYNTRGNRVGYIPLSKLKPPNSKEKLYSFGALSDVHIVYDTAQSDFERALTFLYEQEHVAFTCICGDLTDKGTEEELSRYKAAVDTYSPYSPVFAVAGNHEYYQSTSHSFLSKYTGQALYYTFNCYDDVFVMLGIISGDSGNLFEEGELEWLANVLKSNTNRRVFLFMHILPVEGSGDILRIYPYTKLNNSDESLAFKSILRENPNVIWFHGHSHMRFQLQEYGATANYDNVFGCHSVHIPSLAIPRDVSSSGGYETIYAASEGYVVDVYENGIHLRGRDFVKGEYLPIASYWLDT